MFNAGSVFTGVTEANGVFRMPSYATSLFFLLVNSATPGKFARQEGTLASSLFADPPFGYVPNLGKIGNSSRKIFISDGATYYAAGDAASDGGPDMNFATNSSAQGPYAEYGAYHSVTAGKIRTRAPGNGRTTGPDQRMLWATHGSGKPGGPADTFRFNAAFFDGHVETLGDLEGSNPVLWVPKGTTIDSSKTWVDTRSRYLPGITGNYVIPE
jgi:prepilin-type processing-associated H-X9-DG protein